MHSYIHILFTMLSKTSPNPQKLEFPNQQAELALHLIIVIVHQCIITSIVINYAEQHPQQQSSPSFLTPFINKNRDSHDTQWETYRSNLPILALCMVVWYVVSPLIEKYRNQKSWVLGAIILAYSFRSDLILYWVFLTAWYCFTKAYYKAKYFVISCWLACLIILYINELTNHFEPISQMCGQVMPFEELSSEHRQISFGQVLNMTFLKLISFAADLQRGSQARQLQKHRQKCGECTGKQLCLKGRSLMDTEDFTYKSFMNYLLFAPTLLTGPPLTYKNFISFQSFPTTKQPHIFKFIFLLLCFELYQHYCPVIELNSDQTFLQAEVFTLFHLVFIWFKFLIIWRAAKIWSALCGIEVIDNLSRCVCNNYGFEGFWRMWHRGFNQWLVRYLYIPLGGNRNILSVVATVAFVAFWHDHTINIVIWALALVIFILPQMVLKKYFKSKRKGLFRFYWFKYLCAFSSAVYIYFLVFSNIVGFGYGFQQMNLIWSKVQEQWIWLLWSICVLMSAVVLMFYQRETEEGRKNY